jgi:hypothetical protein
MDNNTAQVYLIDEHYTSIYVNLNGFDQMIFYWSKHDNRQKRKPKWRTSKETIEKDCWIDEYDDVGCRLYVFGKTADFIWGKADSNNRPYYRGRLDDPGEIWKSDYQNNSPSANGMYTGIYSEYYGQPQEYQEEE